MSAGDFPRVVACFFGGKRWIEFTETIVQLFIPLLTFGRMPVLAVYMKQTRIALLGGGIAGVVLARELARRDDLQVTLIEKEGRLGGLHRSHTINGLSYDIGAFVFDAQHQLFRTFPELSASFHKQPHFSQSVTPEGTLDNYPLTLGGYVRDHGAVGTLLAAISLCAGRVRHYRRDTLGGFIRWHIGDRMYRHSGLQRYLERFYGVPDAAIDVAFARQRLQEMFDGYTSKQLAKKIAARLIAHLPGSHHTSGHWVGWVPPREGFGAVYSTIETLLNADGVDVQTSASLQQITRHGNQFNITTTGGTERFDRVISTIPIPSVLECLGIQPTFKLRYLKLLSLFYRLRGQVGYNGAFLYNFTPDGPWKRITTFSKYFGEQRGDHYFTVECTVPDNDQSSVAEKQHDFEEHIQRLGLMRGTFHREGETTTANAYPIFEQGKGESIRKLRQLVLDSGIEIAGRQGQFRYIPSAVVAKESHQLAAQTRAVA